MMVLSRDQSSVCAAFQPRMKRSRWAQTVSDASGRLARTIFAHARHSLLLDGFKEHRPRRNTKNTVLDGVLER
jgi:hypothetical protein